jgi:hypothetical protein
MADWLMAIGRFMIDDSHFSFLISFEIESKRVNFTLPMNESLTENLKSLNLETIDELQPVIICDAWYGFPIQANPR